MVHITASEDRMDSADGSSHTHGNGSTPLSLYTLLRRLCYVLNLVHTSLRNVTYNHPYVNITSRGINLLAAPPSCPSYPV